jgi:hypothetical protein
LPLGLGLATRLIALLALSAAGYSQMMVPGASLSTYWMLVLALLLALGAGQMSLDAALSNTLKRRFPQLEGKPAFGGAAPHAGLSDELRQFVASCDSKCGVPRGLTMRGQSTTCARRTTRWCFVRAAPIV